MVTISKLATLVAGAHLVVLASPSAALAQAAPAPADAPSTAPAPPAANATPEPQVFVHLEGSDDAELQEDKVGDHRHWVTVCVAPCDKAVSSEFSYRIAGDGIRNSRVFNLHAESGDRETLTIDESSKSAFVAGIVVASLGGATALVGTFVALVGSLEAGIQSLGTSEVDHSTETAGLGIVIVGLAGAIAGAVVIASNARTGVTPRSVSAAAGWITPVGRTSEARTNARRDGPWAAAFPPVAGVPLFSGHF
jgi:hypothetical protein